MLFYDSFCIYPCNCYVQFREKIKLSVSVSEYKCMLVFFKWELICPVGWCAKQMIQNMTGQSQSAILRRSHQQNSYYSILAKQCVTPSWNSALFVNVANVCYIVIRANVYHHSTLHALNKQWYISLFCITSGKTNSLIYPPTRSGMSVW